MYLDWRLPEDQILSILQKVNGVFFTGGMVDLYVNGTIEPWTLKAQFIL